MSDPDLSPDCRNCQALCCVLLPFDEGPAFGFDKPAGQECRHLGPGQRCTIHGQLAERGFSGCAAYSCLGAGQRATALMGLTAGWLGDAGFVTRVEDAFRNLRLLHEAAALLQAAARLPLPPEAKARCNTLRAGLDAGRDWTEADLAQACGRGGVLEGVRGFLADLRGMRELWRG